MIKQINTPYFPAGMRYCAPLIAVAGSYLIATGHSVWGILVVFLGAVIFTTKYVTEIDLKNKTYRDCMASMWYRFNKESRQFNSVEKVVVTKGSYSQTINTRAQSRQMDWSDFTATLVLDNGTLDLITRNSKGDLLRGLKEYMEFLNVPVEDRTTNQPFFVDMSRVQ